MHVTFSVSPARAVFPRRQRRSNEGKKKRERERGVSRKYPRARIIVVPARKPAQGAEEPIAEPRAARRVEAERSTFLIDPLDDAGKSRGAPLFSRRGEPARFERGSR